MKSAIHISFTTLLLCMFSFSAHALPPNNRDIDLSDETISLEIVNVRKKKKRKKKRKLVSSFLFNRHIGNASSLNTFLNRVPNLLDASIRNKIYNINLRGINTSPLNGTMPFDIVIDGVSFYNTKDVPYDAFLLPQVKYLPGIQSFDEVSSGSQGVVSITTLKTSALNKGNLTIDADGINQTIYGFNSGKIFSDSFYGISFNVMNHNSQYANKFNKTTQDQENDILISNNYDSYTGFYVNSYALFNVSENFAIRIYSIYSEQNKGLTNGYQAAAEDYNKFLTPEEIVALEENSVLLSTTKASADIVGSHSFTNIQTFGVDGNYYFDKNVLEFGINSTSRINTDIFNIGNENAKVADLSITSSEKETLAKKDVEFILKFRPVTVDYSRLRFGLNIKNKTNQTIDSHMIIRGSSEFIGDSEIDIEYDYLEKTQYMQAYTDYNLELFDYISIDMGISAIYYVSNLIQGGQITSNGTTSSNSLGILEGINNRLQEVGSNTRYGAGILDKNESNFNATVMLPKASLTIRNGRLGNYEFSIFGDYYEGYIPGGLNPYAVSDDGRFDNIYQAQINKTTSAGIDLVGDNMDIKILAFYISMVNVHYLDSVNGLEKYYGNAKLAHSMGGEFSFNWEIHRKWNVDLSFTVMDAVYDSFEHKAYTNANYPVTYTYDNNKIILSPEYTFRSGTSYIFNNGIYLRIEEMYYGPHYFDYANKLLNKGYLIMNGEFGWENNNWAIDLKVKNLLNSIYNKGVSNNPYNSSGRALEEANNNSTSPHTFVWQDTVIKNIGDPMTVGVSLSGKF